MIAVLGVVEIAHIYGSASAACNGHRSGYENSSVCYVTRTIHRITFKSYLKICLKCLTCYVVGTRFNNNPQCLCNYVLKLFEYHDSSYATGIFKRSKQQPRLHQYTSGGVWQPSAVSRTGAYVQQMLGWNAPQFIISKVWWYSCNYHFFYFLTYRLAFQLFISLQQTLCILSKKPLRNIHLAIEISCN